MSIKIFKFTALPIITVFLASISIFSRIFLSCFYMWHYLPNIWSSYIYISLVWRKVTKGLCHYQRHSPFTILTYQSEVTSWWYDYECITIMARRREWRCFKLKISLNVDMMHQYSTSSYGGNKIRMIAVALICQWILHTCTFC